MTLTPEDAQRLAVAKNTARARAQLFVSSVPKALVAKDHRIANALASQGLTPEAKIVQIFQLIDEFSAAAAPYAACKSGCAGCCKNNVAITSIEAERLATYSGRTAASLTKPIEHAPAEFSGIPCPFLVDERCSVYEVRPFACRAHRSFDADSYWCQPERALEGVLAQVKFAGAASAYVAVAKATSVGGFADIRDYFP